MTVETPGSSRPEMHWSRWGDPAAAAPLAEPARALVDAFLGTRETPSVSSDEVRLSDPLATELVDSLGAVVGPAYVLTDHDSRLHRTRGKSTPDLLRIRAGDGLDSPDAVVRPGSHEEVAAVLAWAVEHHVAVVPFGGGTSVVGGLVARREGYAGVVSLDLQRLDRLVDVDPVSRTATLGAGLRGPDAERLLAERGLTLGHAPQSFEHATIGGYAATRSSGQASAGYGRFDALVVGLRVATPVGDLAPGGWPSDAAGPDLRQVLLGSEGAFGVITEVTVRVRPLPTTQVHERWRFADLATAVDGVRALAQSGLQPTVLRLSDESETSLNLAAPDRVGEPGEGGCLVVAGYEGDEVAVAARRGACTALLQAHGGTAEGEDHSWAEGRFRGPYLRDSLLDVGVLVETLETVTSWSRLLEVHEAVRQALTAALGKQALVLCHVSHVYETGASLYFTVATTQGDDPVARWQSAKAAACDALLAHGASITHHHAVGRDHLPWFTRQVGPVGVRVLRALKAELDPTGVLNPGVLVP